MDDAVELQHGECARQQISQFQYFYGTEGHYSFAMRQINNFQIRGIGFEKASEIEVGNFSFERNKFTRPEY